MKFILLGSNANIWGSLQSKLRFALAREESVNDRAVCFIFGENDVPNCYFTASVIDDKGNRQADRNPRTLGRSDRPEKH